MKRVYTKWDKFELPQLTERDYNINWPKGTKQVTKELLCFKACRMGNKTPGMQPALIHFLNIQRLLFPKMVELYKDLPKGRVWNNYYLDVAELLTDFDGTGQDRTLITGPASANKTYGVASYILPSFLMAPGQTLGMVSTTSGTASERRIWADIKDFHDNASYEECGIPKVGERVEYLKAIVYDEGKELGGSDKSTRDFRNGIQVIPIAADSTGETALSAIQGSKNHFVIWVLDEMAQMNKGVTRPLGNLGQNPHFHFIGIGNASDELDPHGQDCMPIGGLQSLNVDTSRRWKSATGKNVLFLHGEETPNNHPFVDKEKIKKVTDYPFPYASNPLSSNKAAEEYGNGDIESGKNTIDYWKFCIGFWSTSTATNTLYTKNLFLSFNAMIPAGTIVYGRRDFGAGDFGFSSGGDDNSFGHAQFGFDQFGKKVIKINDNMTLIRGMSSSKDEFIKQVAQGFVKEIERHNIRFEDFGGDTGNDAALTLNEMSRICGTHNFVGISSIGNANDPKKYKNRVTELWFEARIMLRTGLFRGVNMQAAYYDQLIKRKYQALGKNFYEIERKKDMKKRIGRSPDQADTFIYLMHMIQRSGVIATEIAEARTIITPETEFEQIQERQTFNPDRYRKKEIEEEEFQLTGFGEDEDDYSDGW